MAQADITRRAQIWDGDDVKELTVVDMRAIDTLVTRLVRLAHAGNATKFKDVLHPSDSINPTALIEGMRGRTAGSLPSSVTTHPNHAVFLSSGIWMPTVLGFSGLHDDILFGPIVWTVPNTRHDWRLTAYSF
jgi:hypothetical protein